MNNLVIIGCGGHTRAILSTAKLMKKWKTFTLLDLNFKEQHEFILGERVLDYKEEINKLNYKNNSFFISIGDNYKRKKIYNELIFDSNKKFTNIIHPISYVDESVKMGIGNFIAQFTNLGAESKIGAFNIINTNANLEHESEIGNFNHLAPSSTICGRTIIEDNIFLGTNAVLIEKINIAKNTIIGAGSVVTKSITSSGGKFVGTPAKKI